jgi:purine-binding chemotaxis protein CheW
MKIAENLPQRLLTARLGSYSIGFDVVSIQEVLPCQQVRTIPCADALMRGLINLRGQILTAVDLKTFFKLSGTATEDGTMNIVLRGNEDLYGLIVDSVGDVIETSIDNYREIPINIDSAIRACSLGMYRADGETLLILQPHAIIASLESGCIARHSNNAATP